jgi:hypothetical protein
MRYTASDTDTELTALFDAAQREPVFIERDQKEIAIIISSRQYDRLTGKASRAFNEFCDRMAEEAAAKGLTEEKLQEILDQA